MPRQIVLDTETTGLETKDGHRIIEIGCIEVLDRRITDNHFHCYLNPDRDIDADAIKVHGITSDFLKNHQRFSDIKESFLDYLDGAELIIHNAPFDIGFLNYELSLLDKKTPAITEYCEVLDTLILARRLHPGQRNNLDALCQRYEVDNSNRDLHGALMDAKLLARVYLAMTSGQTQLFVQQNESKKHVGFEINRLPQNRAALKVVRANVDEIKADKQYFS